MMVTSSLFVSKEPGMSRRNDEKIECFLTLQRNADQVPFARRFNLFR